MPRTVISDTWVFDSESGRGTRGMDVTLDDTTIAEVAEHRPAPPDVTLIDGRALFVIPGLIDSHVHLSSARYGVGRQDLPHDLMRRQFPERPDDYLAVR